jgi:hypothetical protein
MERKAVSQGASRPFSVPQLSMKRTETALVYGLSFEGQRLGWPAMEDSKLAELWPQ